MSHAEITHLNGVARLLAKDERYRAKVRRGLQEATNSGGGAAADPLARVRRLNQYLASVGGLLWPFGSTVFVVWMQSIFLPARASPVCGLPHSMA